jgi:medium-chain acyl-[acyl-carrier-protein] hydrolase
MIISTDPADWLVRCSREPAPIRIFAFPFAGGGTSVFRKWGPGLPGLELYGVQLPGRERRLREPPIEDMELLLERLMTPFLTLADRPFVLFGHSMGALIAYELACRLERQGRGPMGLVVSAFRSPELPSRNRTLHTLPDDELITGLREYGATAPEVLEYPELLALLLPMIRADFRLHETYRFPGPRPLSCPVTAITARNDQFVPEEDMAPWRDKTSGAFVHLHTEGGHFYLLDEPQPVLDAIARSVRMASP